MKKEIKIERPKFNFYYGNCCSLALTQGFDISIDVLLLAFNLLKFKNPNEGLTFFECKKIIEELVIWKYHRKIKYQTNEASITFAQMSVLMKTGKYIVIFDEHMSYLENGVIFDRFYDRKEMYQVKPTGWWKIQ